MRIPLALTVALAVSLAIPAHAAAAAMADDGQSVHRCIGAHGEIEFSGLPCATPAPASSSSPSLATTTRDAPTLACPATPDALRSAFTAALRRGDTNAIAALLRWDGVGAGTARRRLDDLKDLVARPLLGLDDAASDDVDVGRKSMTVRTGSAARGSREHTFAIVDDGTCYWLDW